VQRPWDLWKEQAAERRRKWWGRRAICCAGAVLDRLFWYGNRCL